MTEIFFYEEIKTYGIYQQKKVDVVIIALQNLVYEMMDSFFFKSNQKDVISEIKL